VSTALDPVTVAGAGGSHAHHYDFNDVWVFHLRNRQIAEEWWRPEDLYAADEFWT
jgi:hypothetical protein